MPGASSADIIAASLQDINTALQQQNPNSPISPQEPIQSEQLQQLNDILHKVKQTSQPQPKVTFTSDTKAPAEDTSRGGYGSLRVNTRKSTRARKEPTYYVANSATVASAVHQTCQAETLKTENKLQPQTESLPPPKGYAYKAIHPDTGELEEYHKLKDSSRGKNWIQSCSNEIGRLAQGNGRVSGTNTLFFIRYNQIPKDRKAVYMRLVIADRPGKTEPERVRFTAGGDQIEYPADVSTKTSNLVTAKLLINSVLSTPDGRFMTIDLKNFYLNTDMERYEYMFIPIAVIPQDIIDRYNLMDIVHNGKVYVECRKTIYGLPQAGKLSNDVLVECLASQGYHQAEHTHGLFRHETRSTMFTLVVDDFGVQYQKKEDAEHLYNTLCKNYECTCDWEGKKYCGLNIDWDYDKGTADIYIEGYVEKALQRFKHCPPNKPQDSPYPYAEPQYGAKVQYTDTPDESRPMDKKETKTLQEIIGTFLYYARAVDLTMLPALGTLASAQTEGTEETLKAVTHFLNYAATHPEAYVRFKKSKMILHGHSDGSHLSEKKSRSRVGGFFWLNGEDNTDPEAPLPELNGAVHVVCQILKMVTASAAETETAGCFVNGQEACPIRVALNEMGWKQPTTPITTDNSCAEGIINETVKQKRSKAIDMRFYWIRDRVKQGQFRIHWQKGEVNLGDYMTKHHSAKHHKQVRPKYLHVKKEKEKTDTGTAQHCEGVLNTPKGILRNSLSCTPVQQCASPASSQPVKVLSWADRLVLSLKKSQLDLDSKNSNLINLTK